MSSCCTPFSTFYLTFFVCSPFCVPFTPHQDPRRPPFSERSQVGPTFRTRAIVGPAMLAAPLSRSKLSLYHRELLSPSKTCTRKPVLGRYVGQSPCGTLGCVD